MIVKKLILKSFGKFQNYSIDLGAGMNLIIGDNESGKSTVHQFIEGMFYGFYKQNIKNKKNTLSYDKYLPWGNSNDYSGVMIIEDKGKEIRIERSFMKNKDTVNIFDNITGEEISVKYPYDSITKMYQPGLMHLGLSLNSFQNTISITQTSSSTSDELVDEIKDNIINLGETRRVDVSISNVMKILSEKKAAIGTLRSKKSIYNRTKENIDLIENEKENSQRTLDEIKELKIEENNLTSELKAIEKEKLQIERRMAFIKDKDGKDTFEKVRQITAEIEELTDKLSDKEDYAHISKEEINEVLIKLNNSDFHKREYDNQNEKLSEIKNKLESMDNEIHEIDNVIIEIGASEKISRDVYKYEEFENSKKYTGQTPEPDKIDKIAKEISSKKKTKSLFKVLSAISLIITVILILGKSLELFGREILTRINLADPVLSIITKYNAIIITTSGVFFMLSILFLIWVMNKSKTVKALELQLKVLYDGEEITKNRIKDINERQLMLLDKYECSGIEELKGLRDKIVKEELMYQYNYKKARQLEEEKEVLEQKLTSELERLNSIKQKIEDEDYSIKQVMEKLNLWTAEELKTVLKYIEEFQLLEKEKQNKEYVLEEIIKGKSYLRHISHNITQETSHEAAVTLNQDFSIIHSEVLNSEAGENEAGTEFFDDLDGSEESYDELEEKLKKVNDEIVKRNKDITEVSTKIASKENRIRRPALIEEELKKNYEELEKMEFKLNTYTLIEEAIEHISKNIQENFAPSLNAKISKIIAMATDYKYTDVKVSPEMEITVIDQELHKLVKARDLSVGTLDLMYFALRVSIAEIINPEQNVPIILDDTFVQYDERRLIKMLELLDKIQRQIILFTCHKREMNVVGRIIDNVNMINI